MQNMPTWLKNAVFYEIYPQSFLDTDGDGMGNINGITEKLDYIKQLGCNALWLNPCFDSPFGDAGYDVRDYMKIAPRYGTNEDAKRLFSEAHKRDMHVIFDLVPGHTSIDHPWFLESKKAQKNEFSERYVWTNSVWQTADVLNVNGWIRGISERDGSCAVNFFSHQPALNFGFYNKEFAWQKDMDDPGPKATRKAMEDVCKFWLSLGCDGFRVDMASTLIKNDPEHKGIIIFWHKFFESVKKDFPNAAFVSEWSDPYYSIEAGFDMDFLLHFGAGNYMDLFRSNPYFSKKTRGTGNVFEFVKTYEKNMQRTDGKGLICIPSGNHDMDRISRTLDSDEIKLAYAFLLSMPGAPFIYYGDEIGMKYIEGLASVEGGYARTGARSPMQWDGTVNSGFSSASPDKLYIKSDTSEDRPTVEKQMKDKNSIWWTLHDLIEVRKEHKALGALGSIKYLYAKEKAYPFVYERKLDGETVVVAINTSDRDETIDLEGEGEVFYSQNKAATLKDGKLTVFAASVSFIKMKT